MGTRSSLHRRSHSESSDNPLAMRIQARGWGEAVPTDKAAVPGQDLSKVDLFSHDPGPRPTPRIQPKLTVGAPNDRYEQEADRVAAQVMSMAPPATPNVQRQSEEEEEEVQTKPLAEPIAPIVQRQEESEEEEAIQAKCEVCEQEEEKIQRTANGVAQAKPDLEQRLNASKGGGSPLPEEVRSFMEPRFGADFRQVRVHTGGDAVQMNRELNAQAFTRKQDVYFGAGKAPGKDDLTAHELTHVVQQTGGFQSNPIDDKQNSVDDIQTVANSTFQDQRISESPTPDSQQIQRAPGSSPATNVNQEDAIIKAVNLVNKNSLLKIKLPVKAPAGHKVFGGLELKKIELELDIVGEAVAPGLTDTKNTTKVAAGIQNAVQNETDPTKRAATEAQGTVWSLELEQKFGSSPLGEMFSFKPGVEYGSYTPKDALVPNKQEFKGKFGFQIAAEGVSLEVQFIPVAYDKAKKGKDAWKFGTCAGKIAKEFILKAPGLLNVGGMKIDVNLKAKLTGSVEIGPDYGKVYEALGKLLGKGAEKELAQEIAPKIAKEETEAFLKRVVKEMVEDETKDITDAAARKTAQEYAERKLMAEVEKRQLEMAAAEQASLFVRRELTEAAGEKLTIFAIRAEANRIVETLAKPLATELRGALKVMIKEGLEQIGVRSLAKRVAQQLVPGPADFVLIGAQILYNYVDTIVKDIELKELGLRVMACRDNYVAGYTSGLRGGAAGDGAAGAGNLEGAAQMLGLKEGGDEFKAVLDRHLQDSQIPREDAINALKDTMQGQPINQSNILAKAAPKLQEIIMSSYEKKYSGGVMRWMFGEDFKESKDYKNFQRLVEQYLQPGATNTIRTRLKKKGVDKEVYITLVMMDSTSDRAHKFRTEDGKYLVTLSGDTENYSGWVTEDGKPLEEIYALDQAKTDETSSDESKQKHLAEMKQKLSAGVLLIDASYNGLAFSFNSCKLTKVPDGDAQFQEFMRGPEALGMTVEQAGLAVHVSATERFDKEINRLGKNYEVQFEAYGSPHAAVIKVIDSGGYILYPDWHERAKNNLKQNLANRRLAALPKLV